MSTRSVKRAEGEHPVGALVLIIVIIVLYFLPTIIALARSKANVGTVVVINLLLGWTFLGWVVALAMAFGQTKDERAAQTVNVYSGRYPDPEVHGHNAPMLAQQSVHLSPDGRRWWDGRQWQDANSVAPPNAMRSPDGAHWWDGTQWRVVPAPGAGSMAPVSTQAITCPTCTKPFVGDEHFCGNCGSARPNSLASWDAN
jgi:hypothetical protein